MKPDLRVVPPPARLPTILPKSPEPDLQRELVRRNLGRIATELQGLVMAVEATDRDVACEIGSLVERCNRLCARMGVPDAG